MLSGKPPERGLFVTKVFPDSPAEAAGIHTMDVITEYGEAKIIDDSGFFAAKNHYEAAHVPTVPIVVWRGNMRMTAHVRPGWLGVESIDNDKISRNFSSLMNRINSMQQIPEYMYDHEFKGQFDEGPTKILEKANALVDQAERDGTLTSTQILIDRIYMVLDDAPVPEQQRQAELLQQLIATQPANFIYMLGNDRFFRDRRYRAAITCFQHHLKSMPEDVSTRLNLAVAHNQVGMYDEATTAVDYVFANRQGLSEYGQFVAFQNKALASLGRKDYCTAIDLAEKAFQLSQDLKCSMTLLLAAAQMGDRARLRVAIRELQEAAPEKYFEAKLSIDAVDAYALAKTNHRDEAKRIVQGWKHLDRVEGKVISVWRTYPDGMDVAKNFSQLLKN